MLVEEVEAIQNVPLNSEKFPFLPVDHTILSKWSASRQMNPVRTCRRKFVRSCRCMLQERKHDPIYV